MDSPKSVLQQYWGFSAFKPLQEKIVNTVVSGNDCVAILPTGGGKSICYQVPVMARPGVGLVVSPLIALMQDQVNNLKNIGIKAIALTGQLSREEIVTAFDNLQFGNYKFCYLSPEKLQSELVQEKLRQLSVNLIAIDEAHCISEWGHDFRPAYLKIPVLSEIFPDVPVIALTATATNRVLEDVKNNLNLSKAAVFKDSLIRTNLSLQVAPSEDYFFLLNSLLKNIKEPVIIYAYGRNKVKNMSTYLNQKGLKSVFYHGGMSYDKKQEAFHKWTNEEVLIMVATNAFGMGIDKGNVRKIIHLDLPFSLENYMQEAGRAGRDGKPSKAILFANDSQINDLKNRVARGMVSVDFVKTTYRNLNHYFQIAYGELPAALFSFNISDFSAAYNTPMAATYNALKLLERQEVLWFNEDINKPATLQFITHPNKVLALDNPFVNTVLRTYGGLFDGPVKINEAMLAKKIGESKAVVIEKLQKLKDDGIVAYHSQDQPSEIQFLQPREDDITINRMAGYINQQNQVKRSKMKAVTAYAKNSTVCRTKFLLAYFDENLKHNCGNCDICLQSKNSEIKSVKTTAAAILEALNNGQPLSSKELTTKLSVPDDKVLHALRYLLEMGEISINLQQKYHRNE